jgi:hypothetical protein
LPADLDTLWQAADRGEVSDEVFPGGHVWVLEGELDAALTRWAGSGARTGHLASWGNEVLTQSKPKRGGRLPVLRGVPLWLAVAKTLVLYRPALGYSRPVVLYHGAPATAADAIEKDGLAVADKNDECIAMMGQGVYLAGGAKAAKFSRLVGDGRAGARGARDGVVFRCVVDLSEKQSGGVDVLGPVQPTPSVESAPAFVDYCGCWRRMGYAAAFAAGGTSVNLPEFVVADPTQVTVSGRIDLSAKTGGAEAATEAAKTKGIQNAYHQYVLSQLIRARFAAALPPPKSKISRHRYELNAALERWAIALANSGSGAIIFNAAATHTEADNALRVELIAKRMVATPAEADEIIANVWVAIKDAELPTAPTPKCTATTVTAGPEFTAPVTPRVNDLVEIGGCDAVVRMLLYYAAAFSQGQQWGAPQAHIDYLYEEHGVRNEGFASPINSRLLGKKGARFFSAFPEVDRPFGSVGRFFDRAMGARDGGWFINPPFIETILARAAEEVVTYFSLSQKQKSPVFFVMPAWRDSQAYETLHALSEELSRKSGSSHSAQELELGRNQHAYENIHGKRIVARFNSIYFAFGADRPLEEIAKKGGFLTKET